MERPLTSLHRPSSGEQARECAPVRQTTISEESVKTENGKSRKEKSRQTIEETILIPESRDVAESLDATDETTLTSVVAHEEPTRRQRSSSKLHRDRGIGTLSRGKEVLLIHKIHGEVCGQTRVFRVDCLRMVSQPKVFMKTLLTKN